MDNIFKYDVEEQRMIRNVKPWEQDPHYFKEVKISALALLKMVMHARSGGNIEIMGLMQGRVDANTLIVMDSFALPVEAILKLRNMDNIFKYDVDEQRMIRNVKPWEQDPHYFKEVKISALALLKMVMHARSGGNIEIMGLMRGRVDANTLIVMDSFALPVEGTETRVNAQAQAYEYMTNYSESCEPVGRLEKVVGWYHSHPGYGCWLSGIDVNTQSINQQYQEPFVAIVIDPIRTISAGKVDIGAFRTYPKGYKPPDEPPSEYQTIPLNKIEDFGVHCKQYYSLDVTYFKSSLDTKLFDVFWNTYWVNTLCANPLQNNAAFVTSQLTDLAAKMEHIGIKNSLPFRERLRKAGRDSDKLGCEVLQGLMVKAVKNGLFGIRPSSSLSLTL